MWPYLGPSVAIPDRAVSTMLKCHGARCLPRLGSCQAHEPYERGGMWGGRVQVRHGLENIDEIKNFVA